MHMFLQTERLILRRLTEADADLLCDLDSDPEVMRYLNGGLPTPADVMRHEILPAWLRHYERPGDFGYWAAEDRAAGDFLGWFALHPSDGRPSREVEIGYRMRRAAWGRGLATEGARALLRKGFEQPEVARVFGTTYEENFGSRRVMEKVGMTLVRRFRPEPAALASSGTYVATFEEPWDGDDLEYAITRAEWERLA
ncbi:MAG: GNAT family N-acetyltransferase [Dehalococcoidia bacterium]|nr:GNAT family N-acetyltransferase [Dehalococcoidia bacterium]